MPTNWWEWDRQNAAPLKFDPKPSEAAFSAVFDEKCRLELVTSCSGRLMGPDDPVNHVKLVIFAITFLEKLHLKPSEAACSTVFSR